MAFLNHLPKTGPGGHIVAANPSGPFKEGDQVSLECDFGYKLPTSISSIFSKVVATPSVLIWEPDPLPSCIPVQCGPPPILPDHASLTNATVFSFPASFSYVCEEGYVLNHPLDTFYCSASGHWTPTIPRTLRCDPVHCGPLVTPTHGRLVSLIGNGYYGSEATFACDALYEPLGETKRVCQADGQWSGEDVICRPLACPPLDPKKFKLLFPKESDQLQSIDCGEGKIVTIKCLGKGQWSKAWPYCDSPNVQTPSPPPSPVKPETPPPSPPPSPPAVVAPSQNVPLPSQNVPLPSQNVPIPSQNAPLPSQNVPSQPAPSQNVPLPSQPTLSVLNPPIWPSDLEIATIICVLVILGFSCWFLVVWMVLRT